MNSWLGWESMVSNGWTVGGRDGLLWQISSSRNLTSLNGVDSEGGVGPISIGSSRTSSTGFCAAFDFWLWENFLVI